MSYRISEQKKGFIHVLYPDILQIFLFIHLFSYLFLYLFTASGFMMISFSLVVLHYSMLLLIFTDKLDQSATTSQYCGFSNSGVVYNSSNNDNEIKNIFVSYVNNRFISCQSQDTDWICKYNEIIKNNSNILFNDVTYWVL